jgi:hypothetical protein
MSRVSALVLICAATSACSPALVVEDNTLVSEEIICKSEVPVGSRRPKQVCTTAAEREQQRKRAKATVESEQRARGEPIMNQ